MFVDIQREHFIRGVLRKLARQRVAVVLQPGNVWVVERAVEDTGETDAALKTCHMRGCIEPLENAIPKGKLTPDGKLPEKLLQRTGPVYKLTSAGWSVIYRSNQLALIALLISAMSFLLSVLRH